MNVLQAGLASVLVVTLAAALPGLYQATESPSPSVQAGNPSEPRVRDLDLKTVAELSKPDPAPDALPETTVSIEPLAGDARKQAAKILSVEINSADKDRLQTISGIGESTAEAILEYRRKYGSFNDLGDLEQLPGIGPSTVRSIGQQILINGEAPEVESEDVRSTEGGGPSITINLNTALESELTRLDGIGPATAQKIIKYRRKNGSFQSFDELSSIDGIGPATVEKLRNNAEL